MADSRPIAVLDTGAGGLSVVAAIKRLAPHENIHYFADTAHLPYGIKSPELIGFLALKMAKKLVELSSCKVLVIACHTISVWCLEQIQDVVGVPVIGMVSPAVMGLTTLLAKERIASVGVLSTKATLQSRAYRNAWSVVDPEAKVDLIEHACGPLVSLVEESELCERELAIILDQILPEPIKRCDALMIGCTHFSALVPALKKVLQPDCRMVDAADFVADEVSLSLEQSSGFSSTEGEGRLTVYVSDNKERFQIIARRFIDEELSIELIKSYARS